MTNRSRLEMKRQVLTSLKERGPLNLYKIQHALETNYNLTKSVVVDLEDDGLIIRNSPTLKITKEGRAVLRILNNLKEKMTWR